MSRAYKDVSWMSIILVGCLIGGLFLLKFGINCIKVREEYSLPVYISEELSISGYSSYTITGEITNWTDEEVKIDLLKISPNGKNGSSYYYVDEKLSIEDIIIPAHSSYSIYIKDLVYVSKGQTEARGELNSVLISKCIINGEEVDIASKKWLDDSSGVIMVVFGILCLAIDMAIIVVRIISSVKVKSSRSSDSTGK